MIFETAKPTIVVPNAGHMLPSIRNFERSYFRGEMTLNTRLISQSEIAHRQLQVRQEAYRARHAFTVAGVRQLIGNTIIAFGTQLHGKSETRHETLTHPVSATAIGD